jgi:hypothetical protein
MSGQRPHKIKVGRSNSYVPIKGSHCIAYTGEIALRGVQVCTQNFSLGKGGGGALTLIVYMYTHTHTHIVYFDFKKYVIKIML